jgi:hypothetical protein
VYRFATQQCRRLVSIVRQPPSNTPEQWLAVQRDEQLPAWLAAAGTHTLCALQLANELVAPWFYELALNIAPAKAESLAKRVRRATNRLAECANATAWLGALGDPLVAQIEWRWEAGARDHAALHAQLGDDYAHVWNALSALAPYTWLGASVRERRLVVRVALARERGEWLGRAHCRRIAAVALVEALEDRYTATVRRSRPEAVLAGLTQCSELKPHVVVALDERPVEERTRVWTCAASADARNWHAVVRAVAECNAQHRVVRDAALVDAFVPRVDVVRAERVVVHITPALLQAPWFANEMDLQSVAARLYWTLVRSVVDDGAAADDCAHQASVDVRALGVMAQCFRALMDAQFWLELLQLHCGGECASRWATSVRQSTAFRREYRCAADQMIH